VPPPDIQAGAPTRPVVPPSHRAVRGIQTRSNQGPTPASLTVTTDDPQALADAIAALVKSGSVTVSDPQPLPEYPIQPVEEGTVA
jgi:hypothetical protein